MSQRIDQDYWQTKVYFYLSKQGLIRVDSKQSKKKAKNKKVLDEKSLKHDSRPKWIDKKIANQCQFLKIVILCTLTTEYILKLHVFCFVLLLILSKESGSICGRMSNSWFVNQDL